MGPDGVYGTATNMGRFVDTDPTPDVYMYHRQLIRLPSTFTAAPGDTMAWVATAVATTGGAAAEHRDVQRHASGSARTCPRTSPGSGRTSRRALPGPGRDAQQPRRAFAAAYPELVSVVNMPEKTSGHQRKSQAIMSGTGAIGSAPDVQLGTPLIDTTGEITAAQPVAKIPSHRRPRGSAIRATVDGDPVG